MRRLWLLLIPLLLVTFYLGARDLDNHSIWGDEVKSIRDAGGPFFGPLTVPEIWNRVAVGNPWHAPSFFIALKGWSTLVGWSPAALRTLSLFVGLLAVAWTYRLGRDLLSPRAGLYAAIILGTAAFYSHYLYEIRMYAQIVLVTVFTLWIYGRVMRAAKPSKWQYAALLFGMSAVLWTHYLASLMLVALGLYHLLFASKNRRWWVVTELAVTAGLLFLIPWGHVMLAGLKRNDASVELKLRSLGNASVLYELVTLFGNNLPGLTLALGALALLPLVRRQRGAALIWFMVAVMLGLLLVANHFLQIIALSRMRYLLALWPLLALLAGLGLTEFERLAGRLAVRMKARERSLVVRYAQTAAVMVLVVWAGFGVYHAGESSDTPDTYSKWFIFPIQKLTRMVWTSLRDSDAIITFLPDGSDLWFYYNSFDIANFYFNGTLANYHMSMTLDNQPNLKARDLKVMNELLVNNQRVWTAYEPPSEPKVMTDFKDVLNSSHFGLCGTPIDQSDLRVELFSRTRVCCGPDLDPDPPQVSFEHGIALQGVDIPDQVTRSLPIVAGWTVDPAIPDHTYSIGMYAFDASGHFVAQTDAGLPRGPFECLKFNLPVEDLPEGTYTLRTSVYGWEGGARLTGTTPADGLQSDNVTVGTFYVNH